MKEITKKWISYAEEDLRVAKSLFGLRHWRYCVLMCHQAIEKIMKAHLVENDKDVQRIHNLVKIGSQTELDIPPDVWDFIKELNPHYQPNRYPDIAYKTNIRYLKEDAKLYLQKTQETFKWIKNKLK